MTRDEVIKLAREARLHSAVILDIYGGKITALTDSEQDDLRKLEHFAALVATAEREACAKVCDPVPGIKYSPNTQDARALCAAAIRARGKE